MSKSKLLPVLESILDTDGNSLHKIGFPREWNTTKARNKTPLCEFLAKANRLMLDKEVECVSCDKLRVLGNNGNSCEACFRRICSECNQIYAEDDEPPFIRSCNKCNQKLCGSCEYHVYCTGCNSIYCSLCEKEDDVDASKYCGYGGCENDPLCQGCRTPENCGDCMGCRSLVFPDILSQKETLEQDNRELVDENERLGNENKQMRMELDELRKKLSAAAVN